MKPLRFVIALTALCAIPLAASAAKTFVGPSSWNHVVSGTPGAARTMDVWKQSDSPTAPVLNVLFDSNTSYNDMLGQVRTNAQNGGIKIVGDKDRPCAGQTAHEFDIQLGAGSLTTQTIVPDTKGVTRITYTRSSGQPIAKDVQSAIDSFCS